MHCRSKTTKVAPSPPRKSNEADEIEDSSAPDTPKKRNTSIKRRSLTIHSDSESAEETSKKSPPKKSPPRKRLKRTRRSPAGHPEEVKPETIHDSSDDTVVATPLASINPDPEIEALFDGPTQEEVPQSTVKTLDLMKTPKTSVPILIDDNSQLNDSQTSECLFDKSEGDSVFGTAPEDHNSSKGSGIIDKIKFYHLLSQANLHV